MCLSLVGCGYVYLNLFLKEMVEEFTIESSVPPAKYDVVDMSELERNIVVDRVKSFVEELAEDGSVSENSQLVLTQDEINGFLDHSDYLRGNMMISFHENIIEEEYSLPMDVLGYNDRYFVGKEYVKVDGSAADGKNDDPNGTVELKWTTAATHEDWFDGPLMFAQLHYLITNNDNEDGMQKVMSMFLDSGTFFGQNVSQELIDERYDLLESLYAADCKDKNVEYIRNVISGVESVSIEEGRIVVKAKTKKE